LRTYLPINWKILRRNGEFLDTYEYRKLNQEAINQLNRSVTHNEMEATIKSLPKKKSGGPDRL
jgi:hypothetical protein